MVMHHKNGVESSAALLHHPIHPLLIPLPIAAFVGLACSDFVNLFLHDGFWSLASFWLLVAGLVTGLVAAFFGFVDFMNVPGVSSLGAAQVHAIGNLTVLTIALCNLGARWFQPTHFYNWQMLLSLATVGILMGTGWLGGSLVYKHRIGQIAAENGGVNLAQFPAE